MKVNSSLVISASMVAALSAVTAVSAAQSVFTLSNSPSGNELVRYIPNSNGTLTRSYSYPTGGLGSGAGLGSGSISVSSDGNSIVAVNAGSDSLTLFHIEGGEPVFYDVVPSGGIDPVSVTQSGRFVYVLNQGNATTPGNVQEFVNYEGTLHRVPGATWKIASVGAGAQEIKFTPGGAGLVVTEENTNLIDTIQLDYFARPVSVNSQPSTGVGPFGFDFDSKGRLYVTNATGGKADAGTVTSYWLDPVLNLAPITSSAPTHWTAPCWDAVSPNGSFLYVSDAHSGVITGFRISSTGNLTLLQGSGTSASPGGTTLDMGFSANGHYLYVLVGGTTPKVVTYLVQANGALEPIGSAGAPAGSAGLAVD